MSCGQCQSVLYSVRSWLLTAIQVPTLGTLQRSSSSTMAVWDRLWRLPRLTPVLPFSRRHPQAFRQIGNKTRRAGKSAPLTEAAREKGDSQVADESETYTKLGSSRFSSFSHRTEDALATYLHTMEKPFTASQKTDTCCGDTLTRTYDEDPKPSITFIVQMSIGLERLTVGGTDQRLWS